MAEPSAPTGDGPLPDVLAQRALTRQRAQAWDKGDSRVPARRLREPGGSGGKDAQQAAPWDQRRELARAGVVGGAVVGEESGAHVPAVRGEEER